MESIVFRRTLNLSDAKQILADLSQIYLDTLIDIDEITNKLKNTVRIRRMASMYIEGLTSYSDDGEYAIRDYINSTVDTPFENSGFRNLAYSFRAGHTANSVADELIKIIDGVW